jgi:hypothetical protein
MGECWVNLLNFKTSKDFELAFHKLIHRILYTLKEIYFKFNYAFKVPKFRQCPRLATV